MGLALRLLGEMEDDAGIEPEMRTYATLVNVLVKGAEWEQEWGKQGGGQGHQVQQRAIDEEEAAAFADAMRKAEGAYGGDDGAKMLGMARDLVLVYAATLY